NQRASAAADHRAEGHHHGKHRGGYRYSSDLGATAELADKEHIGHIVKLHDNNIYHCRNGHGKYCFPHGGFLKEDLLLPVHEAIPFQRENGRKKAAWANCGHAAFSVREEKFEELENAIFLIAVYPAR